MSQYRPGGFQLLPPVIKNLLIINVIVFLATNTLSQFGVDLTRYFALFHWKSVYFYPWQLVTHMFMHGGFEHLFFNMFALWMFGNVIENVLGTKRFIFFYLFCGVGAALCQLVVFNFELQPVFERVQQLPLAQQEELRYSATYRGNIPMVGASGAVFGLLFAFGYLFPNMHIYLYFLFPIKAKYFVAIYGLLELFSGIRGMQGTNIAHFAHVGGMLFAWILLAYWKKDQRNTYYRY